MENNEMLLPKGYHLYQGEDCTLMGNKKEKFDVKNRSFFEVDSYFCNEISQKMSELITKNSVGKIQVVDLAGGTESKAVKEIEKEFGDRVMVFNLDIAHNIKIGKEANRVQGDATQIPLADSSIDVIYSRQFIPFIMRFNREHNLQVKKVLTEVARVLKPGGIAFLDDEEELSGIKFEAKRKELADELGVTLESHDSYNNKEGNRFLPKFWNKNERREKFLVMRKS